MTRMPIFVSDGRGLVVAGLPQAVAAAAPCSHWGFTGDTTFDFDGGGKLEFTATGQAASGQATQTDQNGHTVTGTVSGGHRRRRRRHHVPRRRRSLALQRGHQRRWVRAGSLRI